MTKVSTFEIKEFDSSSLTGSYQNFGSALSNPAYLIHIFNDSNVHVYVSIDGSTNTWRVADGQSLTLSPFYGDPNNLDGTLICSSGTQLSIKQVTGAGTGFIVANIQMVS